MSPFSRWIVVVGVIGIGGAAVGVRAQDGPQERASEAETEPLLVLAASSLTEVLPRIGQAWEARGGTPLRFSFDATSRLAPQALRSGVGDVFVSADVAWMRWLEERGGLVGESVVVLRNGLVVVVPRGPGVRGEGGLSRGDGMGEPADLAGPSIERIALAGENVPAGRYARQALERAGVWDAVEGRVVRGGSVRGALEWVARGEVEAGIVYATDARAEPRVRAAFRFPDEATPSVVYPAAVLAASGRPEAARELVAFLQGSAADSIFAEAGFQPVDGEVTGAGERRAGEQVGEVQAPGAMPDPLSAIVLTLGVGVLAALLGLVPAIAAGWLLARRQFVGKALVTTVLLAPLVMPPVVTGFLLLALLGRGGPLSAMLTALGVTVPFTPAAPVLAALVVGFPLYVVAVRSAFEAVDPRYEEVSWTLGVPPRRTFVRISLPLALPGIGAGAVLAFARALGEFGATVVLAGNVEGRTRTIALAVYTLLEAPGGRTTMWLLVGASIALSLAALLGYEVLNRRQRRRIEDRHG